MSELIVLGLFQYDPQNYAELKTIVDELSTNTKSLEEGCISYECIFQIDKPGFAATLERWTSKEAEAAHWGIDHLKRSFKETGASYDWGA